MKIAIAQVRSAAGDLTAAREMIRRQAGRAADAGAGLVVFPATALAPLDPLPQPDREGYLADLGQMLSALIGEGMACPAVLPVSMPLEDDPVMEAVFISDGGVLPLRLGGAIRAMAEGQDCPSTPQGSMPMLQLGGLSLGFAFSYEELDEYVAYEYALDAVVFISTYGFATDDAASALGASLSDSRFVRDADAMGAWLLGVGGVGACGLEVFSGSSFAVAPWGEIAGLAPSFEESLLVVDVDAGAEGPLSGAVDAPVFDSAVTAWEAVVEGTRGIIHGLGASDAVVVVDGGPSSMLACVAATDALGPTHVHPLVLLSGDAAADADLRALARNLRLEPRELSAALADAGDDSELARDLAWARARAYARELGAAVVAGTDKTSFALGRASGRDLSCVLPFGDLYRTDVVTLSRLRNTVSPVIPLAARGRWQVEDVEGLPSSGSAESRIELLDYVISSYVEWERPLSDIAADCGNPVLAQSVVGLVRAASSGLVARLLAPQLSSKTLDEARGCPGIGWGDHVRDKGERMDEESLMHEISQAVSMLHESLGEDDSSPSPEDAVDLLGLLGGQGDGGEGREGDSGGKGGGLFWDSPFSDN